MDKESKQETKQETKQDSNHDGDVGIGGSESDDDDVYPECLSVLIIGASASGLGVASALLSALPDLDLSILEASDDVGSSFSNWPPFTRFISPSFYSNPFGCLDLNQVTPEDNGVQATQGQRQHQHPTGEEYATYLRYLSNTSQFGGRSLRSRVTFESRVTTVEPLDWGRKTAFRVSTGDGMERYARYVIYAGGEYGHPYEVSS